MIKVRLSPFQTHRNFTLIVPTITVPLRDLIKPVEFCAQDWQVEIRKVC